MVKAAMTSLCVLFVSQAACSQSTQAPESAAAQPTRVTGGPANVEPVGSRVYIDLAKKLIPSVVNISSVLTIRAPKNQVFPDEFFRKFFDDFAGPGGVPPMAPGHPQQGMALGTGFIIDKDGTILTNDHVVAEASEISISLTETPGEQPLKAKVIGRDPELDIALLKVEGAKQTFNPVVLGNSDGVEIGEYVMAVGNPFGQGHSVTHGIISQKGRVAPDFPLTTYLQTDAPINPGNSGGPLINMRGEVIAVNNAIQANAQGIGFAIPINVAKQVIPELREKGRVTRGYLGVAVQDVPPDLARKLGLPEKMRAPLVAQVTENSPGHRAGLRPYDWILSYDGKPVASSTDLVGAVSLTPPGKTVAVTIRREGKEQSMRVRLGERPLPATLSQSEEPASGEAEPPKAKLGVAVSNLTPEVAKELDVPRATKGVVIASVLPGSPADAAGLQPGDIVLEANRKPITSSQNFTQLVRRTNEDLLLRVRRPNPEGDDTFVAAVIDLPDRK